MPSSKQAPDQHPVAPQVLVSLMFWPERVWPEYTISWILFKGLDTEDSLGSVCLSAWQGTATRKGPI